ncbi:MAG TPA: biopolymer transporter ExbD [Pirellulales bacterium]|jgi:biopolymer transport protein ExbD|nr:biopolymer transporter ExbD [Pirellulales bacterium]
MDIHIECSQCGKKLTAPAERAGKRGRCPSCGEIFVVPSAEAAAPAPDDRGSPRIVQKRKTRPRPLFPQRVEGPDHELIDMTAMVDIVFFLLIFFMVTSMHSLQSSIALPTPEAEAEQGSQRAPQSADEDQVVVQIDADDTVAVDGDEVPSRQELIARLRASERENLLVMASGEAMHGTVVMVLDAGSDAGMDQIRLVSEGLDND